MFPNRIAILGGGASAFDNAQFSLKSGVGSVELFVRRSALPRINPIRFMEFAGFLHHFADLDDATKYAGIDFFMQVIEDKHTIATNTFYLSCLRVSIAF
jgi:cation diffusion facilitator CzcD-associated flavoprotein CzcO